VEDSSKDDNKIKLSDFFSPCNKLIANVIDQSARLI